MRTEAETNANNEENESRATDVRLMKHGSKSPAIFSDSNDSPKNKELEIKKENTKETDKQSSVSPLHQRKPSSVKEAILAA
jgi:hypothetical protein